MNKDIFELKQQFLPLSAREKAPWEHGCVENKVASELFESRRSGQRLIPVPPKDMIGFVLYFICECPEWEWKNLQCPYSLFKPGQVAPSKRASIEGFAILGEDVAMIACSLMHWYGSIAVFDLLRREWTFNLEESRLEHR